jgi:hypothetical protein
VVDISSHGYGHAGQTLPVLQALYNLRPQWRYVVRTQLPRDFLQTRLAFPFEYVAYSSDFGMVMASALDVLPEASLQRYQAQHQDWPHTVQCAIDALAPLRADMLLSNVSYVSLAAAAQLGIPAYAMCSMHWADIFSAYCGNLPGSSKIVAEMRAAYQSARVFFKPAPSMPMLDLGNVVTVGPLARLGVDRRCELLERLQMTDHGAARVVLLSLGGMPYPIDATKWPNFGPHVRILMNEPQAHPNVVSLQPLGMPFIDLLRSCDVLVTKPGYGLVADAACNGIPVVYVTRRHWPEEAWLVNWMHQHNRAQEISREALLQGQFIEAMDALLCLAKPSMPLADGAHEIALHMSASLTK